jgi:hypothetical protein
LKEKFMIIIDDPLSNSFIFPIGKMKKMKGWLKKNMKEVWIKWRIWD